MTMKIAGLLGVAASALVLGAQVANASAVVGDTGARAATSARASGTAQAARDRGVQVAETVIIRRGGGYRDRPYHPYRPFFHRPHDRTVIIRR